MTKKGFEQLWLVQAQRDKKLAQQNSLAIMQENIALRTDLAAACATRDAVSADRQALARECNMLEKEQEYNASLVLGQDGIITHMRRDLKNLRGANRALEQQLADATGNRDHWYVKAVDAEAKRDEWRKNWESATRVEGELQQAQADLDAEPIEVEIAGKEMVEALQSERTLRQVAETGERAARKALAHEDQLRQNAERVCEAMSEMARSRGERLEEAEEYVNDCRFVLTGVRKALDECQVEGKYDASAVMRIRWLNQRAERAEKTNMRLGQGHHALTAAGIPQGYNSGERITIASRVVQLRKRADRAKSLAQLVTPELAEMLEKIATENVTVYEECKVIDFVAKIREALEVNDES